MPYLQKLCGKYVTYEITTSIVWLLIGVFLLFIGKYSVEKSKQYWKKYEAEGKYSDFDCIAIVFGILAICVITVGIIIILSQTFDIITCLTFPEKILMEVMSSLYKTLQ